MRDRLPKKPWKQECGIINLDNHTSPGTHWTSYCKQNKNTYYYDSFGNLQPPGELIEYLGSDSNVYYNYRKDQGYKTSNCGQLCIQFLFNFYNKKYIK